MCANPFLTKLHESQIRQSSACDLPELQTVSKMET